MRLENVSDGRVTFTGVNAGYRQGNILISERQNVYSLKCGSFRAETFDDLFEGVKAIPWEKYLPRNAKFWVTKATTNRSTLFSASAIQSIVKKAMVDRMSQTYHTNRFDEDGDEYPVRVFIMKDEVEITLDTTGVSLHKRGYRKLVGKAPISETLAAALIMLTPWKSGQDPCGSLLRKRYISYRGGHDRCKYRSGSEP